MSENFDFIFNEMISAASVTDAAIQVLSGYASRDRQETHCKSLIRQNNLRICKYLNDLKDARSLTFDKDPPPNYILCDLVRLLRVFCEKAEEYASPVLYSVRLICGYDSLYVPVDTWYMERIIFHIIAFIAENMEPEKKNKISVALDGENEKIRIVFRAKNVKFPSGVHLETRLSRTRDNWPPSDLRIDAADGLGLWLAQRYTALLGGSLKIKNTAKDGFELSVETPNPPETYVAKLRESDDGIYEIPPRTVRYFYGLA